MLNPSPTKASLTAQGMNLHAPHVTCTGQKPVFTRIRVIHTLLTNFTFISIHACPMRLLRRTCARPAHHHDTIDADVPQK